MKTLRFLACGRRFSCGVMVLTCLLIMSGCPGSGVGKSFTGGPFSNMGSVCITGEASYRLELSGSPAADRQFDLNPLEPFYRGSIGGQIRGLAVSQIVSEVAEPMEVFFWGSGAAIKYGTLDAHVGTVPLARPGAVNDIAAVRYGGSYMLVYGSERGLGVVGPDASGTALVDYSTTGAWRPVPSGVTSLAISSDGNTVFFATADGLLQQISMQELVSAEPCSGIVASEALSADGLPEYIPWRLQAGPEHLFLLSRVSQASISAAPNFAQAYYPLLSAIVEDAPYSRVRAISASGNVSDLGFATEDDSFDTNRFDRFIPTDIAWDGLALYVTGLAYNQVAALNFAASNCPGEEDFLKCMGLAADSIQSYQEGELFRFIAGFFVYRDLSDLSKADYFKEIHLSSIQSQPGSPPLIYAMGVKNEQAFVRGPNFLASITRGEAVGGVEHWTTQSYADKNHGLRAGLPNRVAPFQGGAAASYTAVRAADGSGASALEVMSGNTFSLMDTGAIYVRVDGAGGEGLVATIEMAGASGGDLYLQGEGQKSDKVKIAYPKAYVSHADYDGETLAFSWSSKGPQSTTEHTEPWRIWVQEGLNSEIKGGWNLQRAGGGNGEFSGFPAVNINDDDPSLKRHVGGIKISDQGGVLAVMYRGFHDGKWSHQIALYGFERTSAGYTTDFRGITARIETTAGRTAHEGKILSVTEADGGHRVIFSTPLRVYSWNGISDNMPNQIYSSNSLVDAAVDAKDKDRIAIVEGFKVHLRDLSSSQQHVSIDIPSREGTQLTRLVGGRVALSGSTLALALPQGSHAAFMILEAKPGSLEVKAATNISRFIDVKIFPSLSDYLLASSTSSGIEIYSLSGD